MTKWALYKADVLDALIAEILHKCGRGRAAFAAPDRQRREVAAGMVASAILDTTDLEHPGGCSPTLARHTGCARRRRLL